MAQQPAVKGIKIADTLTAEEKKSTGRVILRSELDSLIIRYQQAQIQPAEKGPVKEIVVSSPGILQGLSLFIIILLGAATLISYRQQRRLSNKLDLLNGVPEKKGEVSVTNPSLANQKKGKLSVSALESKIIELKSELFKLSKENEGLNGVIKEYNGIQHEYDSLKHGLLKSYKVRNYPGYDKSKDEKAAMQGVLFTENAVASYAYEKFLKPILAIADANKNSPARTTAAEREKLVNLLVSLSLLYIEYLYLRVNELSIGGKMVERIQGFSKGNGVDTGLLKKLDTEFGSRALVIKMALKNAGLDHLAYPVFDETNLNVQ